MRRFGPRQRGCACGAQGPFRHQGGFNIIGSGRDKIESQQSLQAATDTARRLGLDGLVVIGGDDSNTNAAVLAETFLAKGGSPDPSPPPVDAREGGGKGSGFSTLRWVESWWGRTDPAAATVSRTR